MTSFLLQMVLHPEVQIKAQEEIDRVIGSDRLPTLAESVCLQPDSRRIRQLICHSRKDLPYIDAILNEVMRIHPIAPMTFYEAEEDHSYRSAQCLP
jgi:cytochrome P450